MSVFAHFRTIVFSTAFAAIFVLCTNAATVPAGPWTSVRSLNFFLAGDADDKDIRAIAVRLEQFREALRLLYPTLKLPASSAVRVFVFKNAASYRDFKPKRADGTPDDSVAGFFVPGEDVDHITLSMSGERSDPFETAAHEYFHAVINANAAGSTFPPWLNEGLAGYFQTLRLDPDRGVIIGLRRTETSLLRRSTPMLVRELIEVDGDRLALMPDQPRGRFYASSAALVQVLMRAGDGDEQARLGRFLTYLRGGDTDEGRFSAAFQINYQSADTRLRSLADAASPAPAVTLPLRFGSEWPLTSASVSAAQAMAWLGDLLGRLDETAEAEAMLRRATDIDSGSAVANSALGKLLLRQERFAEAVPFFEKAIAADPQDFLVRFNYAYALNRSSADAAGFVSGFPEDTEKRMRAALQKAIELKPDFAESYRLLAFVDYVNGSELNEAVSLLKKGLELRPGDAVFESLLAQVLLRQERYGEAKEVALRVRKTASDPKLLSDADEVLRVVDEYSAVRPRSYGPDGLSLVSMPRLLLLKRSSVTDADIARFDEDRRINNLNRILERPADGEKQIVGYIDRVNCSDDRIDYTVRTTGGSLHLSGADFGSLRMAVLIEGQNTFRIDCGSGFGGQLAVLTYRPDVSTARSAGRLLGITFVPDFFRLKTTEELAKAKLVVVEDDTPRGSHHREKQP